MKRYDIEDTYSEGVKVNTMMESIDGEWVKFEDVEKKLDILEKAFNEFDDRIKLLEENE